MEPKRNNRIKRILVFPNGQKAVVMGNISLDVKAGEPVEIKTHDEVDVEDVVVKKNKRNTTVRFGKSVRVFKTKD